MIDNKPLFLISWQAKHATQLKIKSLKTYHKPSGSVIVLLPLSTHQVVLLLKNTWRTTTQVIPIQRTSVNSSIAHLLLQNIKQLNANGEIQWITPLSSIKTNLKEVRIKQPGIQFKVGSPQIVKYILRSNSEKIIVHNILEDLTI